MYIALLAVLLILIIADFMRNRKIYSPGIIFNGIFFVTLFLYVFKISYIQDELLPRTVLCLWLSVIVFNVIVFGYYFTHKKFNQPVLVEKEDRYFYGITPKTRKIVRNLILVIFLIEIIYSKGFPLLWKLTGSGLTYFDFGVPSLNGVFCGLVMLFGAYSLFLSGMDKYICLSIGVLIINRQLIIAIVIEGIIFKIITSKKEIKHLGLKLIITVIVGIIVFSLIGNMRTGEEEFLRVGQFKKEYDWVPTSVKWVYSYLCFSISNFNLLVSQTMGFENFGASCFNYLLPTVLSNLFSIKENATYGYLVSNNFTVSTSYPELYLDFGLLGIIFQAFFIAALFVWSFNKYRKKADRRYAMIYAIIAHNVLMFFFNNMFLYLPVVVQFIYVPLMFSKREKTLLESDMSRKKSKEFVCKEKSYS